MASAAYLCAWTLSRGTKTPYKLLCGWKPNLSHLREIGAHAFVLHPGDIRKMEPRSEECVLISYGPNSKTYHCYHRKSHQVIESFHVKFIECKDAICSDLKPASVEDTPAPPIPAIPEAIPSTPLSSTTPANTASTKTTIEEVPDVEASSGKEARKLWCSATLANYNPDHLPVPEALAAFINALNSTDDQSQSVDLDSIVDLLSEAFNIDVMDELPDTDDPCSFKDAMQCPEKALWEDACKEEFESLKEMRVFTLIPPTDVPPDRKVLRGKWALLVKRDKEGKPVRYKAQYVFWGCGQVPGRNYNHTTSPTARLKSFRMLLHIVASLDWDIHQFDVKTAFLHGLLDEEEFQYMEQPEGFKEPGKEDWVWHVEKGLYSMHQAGCVWNQTLNDAMVSEWGFTRLPSDYCVYYHQDSHGTVITAIHVDNFISITSSAAANQRFHDQMLQKWKISESGVDFHLGIAIQHDHLSCSVYISQTAMIDAVVQDFCSPNAHPVSTLMSEDANETLRHPLPDEVISLEEVTRLSNLPYPNLVARLMYIGLGTQFDIVWSIRKLAEFLDCYRQSHWDAAIRVV